MKDKKNKLLSEEQVNELFEQNWTKDRKLLETVLENLKDQITSKEDYVENKLGNEPFLYRAVVVDIDQAGGILEKNPPNPKNSIKARIITDGMDSFLGDEDLNIFWPFFPHDVMPLKQGEHCYVIFEDMYKRHGLWLTRIPEPLKINGQNVDDVNYTLGSKKFELNPQNSTNSVSIDKAICDTTLNVTKPIVAGEFSIEKDIPKFKARVGDRVIEGSNNTTIILGRDRVSSVNSGEKTEAGSIDVVVGRKSEDIDLKEDKSMLYLTMKSDVDGNFGINVGTKSSADAFAVIKSNEVRIIARKGLKMVVEAGDVVIEGNNIFVGNNAQDSAVLGDKFNIIWQKLITALRTHNHPSPIPNFPNPAAFLDPITPLDLSTPLAGPSLSKTVKVKP
jgi:hypothetical protein